uniref:Uncharacterized protein n=1 Tax=Pseudonaja textilis TaxID=8673 RepID=A0A670ZAS4_PSETE
MLYLLSIYLPIYLPIYVSTYLPTYLPIHLSISIRESTPCTHTPTLAGSWCCLPPGWGASGRCSPAPPGVVEGTACQVRGWNGGGGGGCPGGGREGGGGGGEGGRTGAKQPP